MKKKISCFVAALIAVLSFAALSTGCAKEEQSNDIRFTGLFQDADGSLYAKIENQEALEGKYLEYTDDNGAHWNYLEHSRREFNKTPFALYVSRVKIYDELTPGEDIKIALRIAETDTLKASEPTEYITYRVKPVHEQNELFLSDARNYDELGTSEYSYTQSFGIKPYCFFKDGDNFKIERFDYAASGEGNSMYTYTYAPDNWDKSAVRFEYKFVPTEQAFFDSPTFKTALEDYYDIADVSVQWTEFNNTAGLTKAMYESHIENTALGCIGCYNRAVTILIRHKAAANGLPSKCSAVFLAIENILGELPA